MMYDLCMYLAD